MLVLLFTYLLNFHLDGRILDLAKRYSARVMCVSVCVSVSVSVSVSVCVCVCVCIRQSHTRPRQAV